MTAVQIVDLLSITKPDDSPVSLDLAGDVVMLNTGCVDFAGSVNEVRNNDNLIAQHLGVF